MLLFWLLLLDCTELERIWFDGLLVPFDTLVLVPILLRKIRLMLLTDGTLYLSQTLSCNNRSRISHANIPGSFCLRSLMYWTTFGVVTRGLLPPIAPGRMEPVSWKRAKIFDTQPCETLNWRLMSHGRTPNWANSTIRRRMALGNGRPLTNTPPNWFTSP